MPLFPPESPLDPPAPGAVPDGQPPFRPGGGLGTPMFGPSAPAGAVRPRPGPDDRPDRSAPSTDALPLRAVLALFAAPFLGTLVITGPASLLLAVADLGVSVPLLGQVASAIVLLGIPLRLVLGPVADRRGHRRMLLLGLASAALALVGWATAPTAAGLLAVVPAGAVAVAILPPLVLAAAAGSFPASRQRAVGVATAGLAGSAVVGVPLLAFVAAAAGWRVGLIAIATAGLVAVPLVWFGLPPSAAAPGSAPASLAAYRRLATDAPSSRLLAAALLRGAGWSAMLTYLGAILADRLHLGAAGIGATFLIGGLGYVAGGLVAARLLADDRTGRLAAFHLVLAVFVALTTAGTLGPVATVALQAPTALVGAVAFAGLASRLGGRASAAPGATMAVHGAALNLGAALGGALGGGLLTVGGFPALALGLGAATAASAVAIGLDDLAAVGARPTAPRSTDPQPAAG